MKQETNNEMDLLLRRLSRREGAVASDAELRIDSDHLDADELTSYAENVLPAAARAHYTEHLAECARCRELVVQLSASVPVVAAKETLTAEQPSGLKKFLASLFSPMVLRYAVPALGLIVISAIGIAVYRSEQPSFSVAQVEPTRQPSPAAAPSQGSQSGFLDLDAKKQEESQSSPAKPDTRAGGVRGAEPTSPSDNAPAATGARAEPQVQAPVQKEEAQPSATPAPPPAAPKPEQTVDEMRVEVEGRRPAAAPARAVGDLARQKNSEISRDGEKKSEEVAAAPSPAKLRSADSSSPQGGTSSFGVAQQKEKDRADGVIRTVAGRRFRKQDAVWVDTAYDSGNAITNVARNSEQYRALIADEPTIKTIADELDGAIIVVWKGRTYRIR